MMHEQKEMDRWLPAKERPENLQLCLSNSNIERSGGSAGDPLKRSGNLRHAEERSSNHNWQSRVALNGPSTFVRRASRCLSRIRRNVLRIRFCHS